MRGSRSPFWIYPLLWIALAIHAASVLHAPFEEDLVRGGLNEPAPWTYASSTEGHITLQPGTPVNDLDGLIPASRIHYLQSSIPYPLSALSACSL